MSFSPDGSLWCSTPLIEYSFGTVATIAVIAASHGYMAPDRLPITLSASSNALSTPLLLQWLCPPLFLYAPLIGLCVLLFFGIYMWHIHIYGSSWLLLLHLLLSVVCSICSSSLAPICLLALICLFWHIYYRHRSSCFDMALRWLCSYLFMNLLCIPYASCHPLVSRILPYWHQWQPRSTIRSSCKAAKSVKLKPGENKPKNLPLSRYSTVGSVTHSFLEWGTLSTATTNFQSRKSDL